MTHKDNGGPAFPGETVVRTGVHSTTRVNNSGMSLRDYAAIHAHIASDELSVSIAEALMGGKVISYVQDPIAAVKWWAIAEAKLRIIKADAMLSAREAKP
jgi:hypothetical protein